MNPVIFKNVSHFYGHRKVLDKIDLTFNDEKITVILGKSGSGKSTLLQMINGLITPSQGFVEVFGDRIDYNNIYQLRRTIGYSVQGTGLFPHMTVFENIALLPKISGQDITTSVNRIDHLMKFVDLDSDFRDKYPHQLSGGEQQRVGICRAMILNPKIFLLDEAFGALDIMTRNEIHEELLSLQEAEPRTIILVTHDVTEAIKLANKLIILDAGIVQQYASPEEILNNPANISVEKFLRNYGS
jgi:osmoprotectant transport system ATP-binding protein